MGVGEEGGGAGGWGETCGAWIREEVGEKGGGRGGRRGWVAGGLLGLSPPPSGKQGGLGGLGGRSENEVS